MEKLRLALLTMLRFEGDGGLLNTLKHKLQRAGLDSEEVAMLDAMMEYAGKENRTSDLF